MGVAVKMFSTIKLLFVERNLLESLGTQFKFMSVYVTGVLLRFKVTEVGAAMKKNKKKKKCIPKNYGSITVVGTSCIYEGT